ncbi:uncharacterized protein LOC113515274 [Galleria mellonella]|uniref:Uncharacterized protein LOC113515274 n=1 Tax=Galleria mellonella TaxID=7137 RepID=A0ABM3N0W2_GALME|nr:uncharacterized protein LOC113515274 [Galleria mellonella]
MADQEVEEGQPINFGQVIGQKLTESIQSMDLLTVLQKMVAVSPEDEESEEVREKLKNILKRLDSMSDEEREVFTKQVKDGLASKLSMKLQDPNVFNTEGLEDAIKEAIVNKLILVGVGGLILIIVLVFFGYKLYKSIKDKEKKKEEKKKAKQLKKKK